ncbi:MAG: bifunctional riboflavin kinase/FAD synthetase [Acidobacteriaceae bacterium]
MAQHYTSLEEVYLQRTWLTIGSFDGVHRGHQKLIQELNQNAHQANQKSIVLTFHPHPAVILRQRTDPFYLTTISEKNKILESLGPDIIITHPFTFELSQSSARDFVTYLLDHLGFQQLWVGYDFALGKGRQGNVDYLKQLGMEFNYQVHIVDPVVSGDQVISSSTIRSLLLEGNVEKSAQLLGRPYQVEGEVVHGDGRGKSIGIPTANIEPEAQKLIPGAGVYACRVELNGEQMPAAVNIGTRPTFEDSDHTLHVEAHILDYSGDLYTQVIGIEFISRLRGEERFESVEALIQQEHVDIRKTRSIVARMSRREKSIG